MGLFMETESQSCYLKAGLLGFAGSGKSRTASEIAIGLHKYIKSVSPVLFLDTETGSDYLRPLFEKNSVRLLTSKSRAFTSLLLAIKEAEEADAILIIDSITHFWVELMDAFKKEKKINRILLPHWAVLKDEWRKFSEAYINSKCHIIMCGRAGWEFDRERDDEGVMELIKTGTKMKAESEIGFEPSILIEMERVRLDKGKVGSLYKRRAWVIKERFGVIDGKFFDNPTFDSFLPHIKLLNIGGEHVGVDTSVNSQECFAHDDNSTAERMKKRDILLEELKDALFVLFNTRTDEGKKEQIKLLENMYGTSSFTAIASMSIETIESGLVKIREMKGVKK